jgi:hypothetical protein
VSQKRHAAGNHLAYRLQSLGDDFPRIVHIVPGIGGKDRFHLLAPGVHIFGINVNLGGAAGNRPAHILIGNTGAAMQHQRNLHPLGNGFHLGKSQSGFTFIQTMGGAQRGGEAIHLRFCHQGVALLGSA